MNKHNLLKRIASVATELDQSGFTKEAKSLDLILLKLAQEKMNISTANTPQANKISSDNSMEKVILEAIKELEGAAENKFKRMLDEVAEIRPEIRTLPRHLQELSVHEYFKSKRERPMMSDLPPDIDKLSMEEFIKSKERGPVRSDLPDELEKLSIEEFMK